jgi:hypothetical protein
VNQLFFINRFQKCFLFPQFLIGPCFLEQSFSPKHEERHPFHDPLHYRCLKPIRHSAAGLCPQIHAIGWAPLIPLFPAKPLLPYSMKLSCSIALWSLLASVRKWGGRLPRSPKTSAPAPARNWPGDRIPARRLLLAGAWQPAALRWAALFLPLFEWPRISPVHRLLSRACSCGVACSMRCSARTFVAPWVGLCALIQHGRANQL